MPGNHRVPATPGRCRTRGQDPSFVSVCFACPLLNPCRAWALDQPAQRLHGIWGATTHPGRRHLRKRHRKANQTAAAGDALDA
ncbi:WhiB family transcriptional regulator [Micromonospora sp. NPDC047707]|uniref:WhiB family transcriptional regulator n=1 Tax=Micromonospora sp. NPDC047707 TaxID=3154498 RepID=UPI003451288A